MDLQYWYGYWYRPVLRDEVAIGISSIGKKWCWCNTSLKLIVPMEVIKEVWYIYYSAWAEQRCCMRSCMAYTPLTQQWYSLQLKPQGVYCYIMLVVESLKHALIEVVVYYALYRSSMIQTGRRHFLFPCCYTWEYTTCFLLRIPITFWRHAPRPPYIKYGRQLCSQTGALCNSPVWMEYFSTHWGTYLPNEIQHLFFVLVYDKRMVCLLECNPIQWCSILTHRDY